MSSVLPSEVRISTYDRATSGTDGHRACIDRWRCAGPRGHETSLRACLFAARTCSVSYLVHRGEDLLPLIDRVLPPQVVRGFRSRPPWTMVGNGS